MVMVACCDWCKATTYNAKIFVFRDGKGAPLFYCEKHRPKGLIDKLELVNEDDPDLIEVSYIDLVTDDDY